MKLHFYCSPVGYILRVDRDNPLYYRFLGGSHRMEVEGKATTPEDKGQAQATPVASNLPPALAKAVDQAKAEMAQKSATQATAPANSTKGKGKDKQQPAQAPKAQAQKPADKPTEAKPTKATPQAPPTQQAPQGTAEGKAAKILSWKEATALIPTEFKKRDSGETFKVTKESLNLRERLKSHLGASREHLLIPGYNDGEKRSFKQVYGMNWDKAEAELENARATKGCVLVFSLGPSWNHGIIIVPAKGQTIEAETRDGKKVKITRENCLEHTLLQTNHGRSYKKARSLAKKYGLAYRGIDPGMYVISNTDNWNFFQKADGKWAIYSSKEKGYLKDISCQPEDLLLDFLAGGDKFKKAMGLTA